MKKANVLLRAISFRKSVEAACFGIAGIRYACTNDSSFARLVMGEFLVAVVLILLLWPISLVQIGILIPLFALPIATELINVAIEEVVDLVSPGFHEKAKNAKDCAAGATLIATTAWLVVSLLMVVHQYLF